MHFTNLKDGFVTGFYSEIGENCIDFELDPCELYAVEIGYAFDCDEDGINEQIATQVVFQTDFDCPPVPCCESIPFDRIDDSTFTQGDGTGIFCFPEVACGDFTYFMFFEGLSDGLISGFYSLLGDNCVEFEVDPCELYFVTVGYSFDCNEDGINERFTTDVVYGTIFDCTPIPCCESIPVDRIDIPSFTEGDGTGIFCFPEVECEDFTYFMFFRNTSNGSISGFHSPLNDNCIEFEVDPCEVYFVEIGYSFDCDEDGINERFTTDVVFATDFDCIPPAPAPYLSLIHI